MGRGGEGHGRRAGSVNHQRQPGTKSRGSHASRVGPGEPGTPGAEQNRVKGHLPRPSKEREEGAVKRNEGVVLTGIFSGMVS